MADVTNIVAGRWGFTRILPEPDGDGWTTHAMLERLGDEITIQFPPLVNGAFPVPFAMVRLNGAIISPSTNDTILIPRNLTQAELTLGDLTAQQRLNLRNFLETLAAYSFTDWDGTLKDIPGMSAQVATYTTNTLIRDLLRDLYRYLGHSASRPRMASAEWHNTEHLDGFDTSHETRWTACTASGIGNGTWDGTDLEVDFSGDQGAYVRYSANNSGSIEHEAQITGRHTASVRCLGPGVRMSTNSGYGISRGAGPETQLWKLIAGTRTNPYTSSASGSFADLDFVTLRLAASGGNGANVELSMWVNPHLTGTKPSDPGWWGTDGSPTYTYTDTAADRLDDSAVDLDCGLLARGMVASVDTRHNYFKLRAIADRGGASHNLSGSLADASSISGSLAGSKPISGSLADSSAISALVAVARTVSGSLSSACEIAGSLTLQGQVVLAGSLDSASTIAAALQGTKPLSGSLTSGSTIAGSLDTVGAQVALVGSLSMLSALSASLGLGKGCAGIIVCSSSVDATMRTAWALSGAVSPQSALSAVLSIQGQTGNPFRIFAVTDRGFIVEATARTFTFDYEKEG